MEKIRVLYLITSLGKGGAERFLVDLCNQMIIDSRFEICLATLFHENKFPDLDERVRVTNLNFKVFSFRKKNECLEYKELLISFQPNIVHTNLFLAEFLSSYYVDTKIKYVCHGHDNMIQFSLFSLATLSDRRKMLNFVEYNWLKWKKYRIVNTWFIANSVHTFEYYQKVLPKRLKNKVQLIQYGFNFEKFNKNFKSVKQNNKHDFYQLINVGSFQHKKNQRFFIDVAIELNKLNFPFQIHLIGDGELKGIVEKEIVEKGLQNQIFTHGIQHNVDEWYSNSNLYVHAATYEPFGLVFLEAMASGLPIVTLDGKGNKDIIQNGKNGWILEEVNPIEFAKKIISCLENEHEYALFQKTALAAAKNFDQKIKNEELLRFYKTICNV